MDMTTVFGDVRLYGQSEHSEVRWQGPLVTHIGHDQGVDAIRSVSLAARNTSLCPSFGNINVASASRLRVQTNREVAPINLHSRR